jgi:hypothetical protein
MRAKALLATTALIASALFVAAVTHAVSVNWDFETPALGLIAACASLLALAQRRRQSWSSAA